MESFSFSRTISRSFGLLRGSFGSVGLFMLFFSAISFGLNQLFRGQLVAAMAAAKPGPSAGLAMFSSAWYWLLMLSSLILASVQWAGAIDGLLKTASGAPTSLGECFSKGLAKALPFLALSVLWILGVTFAGVLFVIPGLILMTMWSVSLPASRRTRPIARPHSVPPQPRRTLSI